MCTQTLKHFSFFFGLCQCNQLLKRLVTVTLRGLPHEIQNKASRVWTCGACCDYKAPQNTTWLVFLCSLDLCTLQFDITGYPLRVVLCDTAKFGIVPIPSKCRALLQIPILILLASKKTVGISSLSVWLMRWEVINLQIHIKHILMTTKSLIFNFHKTHFSAFHVFNWNWVFVFWRPVI